MTRGATLALLLGGAGLGFLASAQAWWQASGNGAAVTFSGSDVTGGLSQALAAVALAGLLLVLVLRVRGRRVLAVALAATGLGMVVTGAWVSGPDADTVRSRVRQVSLTDQFALSSTGWPWVYAAAGLVLLVAAALLWWGAPRWTSRTSRFERTVTPDPTTADLNTDPARVWKDLDAGLDPTDPAVPSGDVPEPAGHPDVRADEERVTMDPTHDQRRE